GTSQVTQPGAAQEWIIAPPDILQLDGKPVRIHESDRSGAVLMSAQGLVCYGDAEVYLKINFPGTPPTFRYLSAPLHTPVDVVGVRSVVLLLLPLPVPAGTHYNALVNAHCVYELL